MKISIITVCYNAARTIRDALESVAAQAQGSGADAVRGIALKPFAELTGLIVKETADGNRTWTIEFSNRKELTGVPTTGEAATVEVTRLKPPSTHTILKWIYGVNGGTGSENRDQGSGVEIEHIVVDGGSTDGTVREIEDFAKKVKVKGEGEGEEWNYSFRWVSEKDRGMYDAMNKGIRMATGDVIGILNADDVLDGENVLRRIVRLFDCSGCSIDCLYGNVRFVSERGERGERGENLARLRALPTVRICFARWWRPWMLQWGYMPPHPAIFIRRECFAKWGRYEPDRREYRIAADYELLIRFFRVHRMRARYMPVCTTVMRTGGVSTRDVEARRKLNEEIVKANRANGYFCCFPMLLPKYFVKIWEFVVPRISNHD